MIGVSKFPSTTMVFIYKIFYKGISQVLKHGLGILPTPSKKDRSSFVQGKWEREIENARRKREKERQCGRRRDKMRKQGGEKNES